MRLFYDHLIKKSRVNYCDEIYSANTWQKNSFEAD